MAKCSLLLILAVVLFYFNALDNGFVWDDLNNIVNNQQLDGPVSIADVFLKPPQPPARFYRPIPYLSIVFDHWLWKKNPFGYHLTNLVFHLANAILVFYLAKRFTNTLWASLSSGLLFILHPVQTEAVSYISGRSDLFCAFFLLGAVYFYIGQSIARRAYTITWFFFLAGLFSKELALIFPLLLFFYEIYFLKSRFKLAIKITLPFLLTAIAFLLFKCFFIAKSAPGITLNNFYLAPRIFLFYLRLLFIPFNLHMQHSLNEDDFVLKLAPFLCLIIFLWLCIFAIIKARKNKIFGFGLGWFFVFLFPFLGFLKLNADMAEHWLYLASFGFFLCLSQLAILQNRFILPAAALALGLLTAQRNDVWQNDISIYQDALKYNPGDSRLHYNLGNAYLRRNLLNQAYQEYSIAIRENPDYAYALNNLGLVKEKMFEFTGLAFAEENSFDHSLYQKVLTAYLKGGLVDYAGLKNNPAILDEYLKNVSELEPQTLAFMPDNEKIAFYLNVYNAVTLKIVSQHYPLKSIKDIPGVWDKIEFMVAGKNLTLNQIEHDILRKEFKEPRIHFALVCASRGCPELASIPFNGKSLDEQLKTQAKKFINNQSRVRLDKDNFALYLSSIFKWFKDDFGNVIEFISKYLPEDEAGFINQRRPRVRYLDYDWSLNSKN